MIHDSIKIWTGVSSCGVNYSGQACAEPIEIAADGRIAQVEMTSCGLHQGYLQAEGTIPATKACDITNSHMPHISNRNYEKSIPMCTNDNTDRFITNGENGNMIGYKYFRFPRLMEKSR